MRKAIREAKAKWLEWGEPQAIIRDTQTRRYECTGYYNATLLERFGVAVIVRVVC